MPVLFLNIARSDPEVTGGEHERQLSLSGSLPRQSLRLVSYSVVFREIIVDTDGNRTPGGLLLNSHHSVLYVDLSFLSVRDSTMARDSRKPSASRRDGVIPLPLKLSESSVVENCNWFFNLSQPIDRNITVQILCKDENEKLVPFTKVSTTHSGDIQMTASVKLVFEYDNNRHSN